MVTDRFIEQRDIPLLSQSLSADEYHINTKAEFFTEPGTITKVYEDDKGPILFLRGSSALRLDIQFVDNNDVKRNMTAMLDGFDKLAKKAKEHGYHEVIFNTSNAMLKRFCEKRFGFVASNGELRKVLA